MTLENSIERILKVVDSKVNKYYNYNEPSLVIISKNYIKKYISFGNYREQSNCRLNLKVLCITCYLIAMKYQLDSHPTINHYSIITNISEKTLLNKELDLAKKFLFNFTP